MLFQKKVFFLNLQLTLRFWRCTVRMGESVAYRESPSQRGRLGRSDCIEASWLNLLIFSSLFCNTRKLILTIFSESEVLWTFFSLS